MTVALWAIVAIILVPSIVFVVECLAGFARSREAPFPAAPPFVVLMPAHDEAAGIARTVNAVTAQLRTCDWVLVVADNCSDRTAAIARSCGAFVVEREDATRRGKGYALDAGRTALLTTAPPVVVVLDADCVPQPGALQMLAAAAHQGSVIQGLYLMAENRGYSARAAISTFAFVVKNLVRQRGLRALHAPALLQGSGMAFPWPVFVQAPLATGEIVEDLELGLKLALSSVPIRFLEPAKFLSPASSEASLKSQRTRWEHGSLGVARRFVPELAMAVLRGRVRLLPLLLDLTVPPLALLVATMAAMLAIALLAGFAGGDLSIAFWVACDLCLLGVTIVGLWFRFARSFLPIGGLLRLPGYLLWKLPVYGRLLGHREQRWIRTGRD